MARSNWREADLRGPGRRPASVAGVVETVGRALAALRSAEAVLFGLASATVTLAAAVASGVAPERREGWVVALLAGACAGLAWWLADAPRCGADRARRRSPADSGRRAAAGPLPARLRRRRALAERMDARLRHQGALASAYEAELRGSATSCARLLSHRVLQRLRTREALRAMLPPLLPPVAAPLVGAFLLAGAIERARPEAGAGRPPARELVEGLLEGLDRLEGAAGSGPEPVDGGTRAALLTIEGHLRELRGELRRSAADERTLEELERVERELDRQSAALGARPEARRELSALRAWLDQARRAVQSELGAPDEDPDAGAPPSAGEPAPALAGGPAGGAGSAGSSIAPAPPTGTMAADPAGARSERLPRPGEEAASGSVGSWWPPEHDPVVERWVEARRRALAEATGGEAPR